MVYHYDLQGHLIAETSGTGARLRTYVWRDDTPLAQIEYVPSRKILYYDVDHLNTPRAARDEAAKVVWRWESDAFGSTYPNEDPDGDGQKVVVNLRFPGQYYDQETGLHQNYFRDYDSGTGRYIEPDPLGLLKNSVNPLLSDYSQLITNSGLASGLNYLYSYAGSNPESLIDPLGLKPDPTQPNDDKKNPEFCSKYSPTYAICHGCCARNNPFKMTACIEQCAHRNPSYPDAPYLTQTSPPSMCSSIQ